MTVVAIPYPIDIDPISFRNQLDNLLGERRYRMWGHTVLVDVNEEELALIKLSLESNVDHWQIGGLWDQMNITIP